MSGGADPRAPGPGAALELPAVTAPDQLGLLASVSEAFASSLDLEETLQNAVTQIAHYMHAEAGSLFLLEEGAGELVCRACAGPVDLVGLRLDAERGIVGKTVRAGQVQLIRDAREDPDFAGGVDASTGFRTRSILCAPLVVKGRALGALEILNKSGGDGLFDASDRHMLQVLAASASLVIHNARMAAQLVEQERIRKELELAREIQANLLPRETSVDARVAGINLPAWEVSGDFYDHFRLDDGRYAFSLGDVSGKGMNAALLMAKTTSLLHCLGKSVPEPAELLRRVNAEVTESVTRGMFVTLVAGTYDPASGLIRFANAGHQPPLHLPGDGSVRAFPAQAPPLGILPELEVAAEEVVIDGGGFYLYSDGVTEAELTAGRPLGVEGLVRLLDAFADLPPRDRVARVAHALVGTGGRVDDITLLAVERG